MRVAQSRAEPRQQIRKKEICVLQQKFSLRTGCAARRRRRRSLLTRDSLDKQRLFLCNTQRKVTTPSEKFPCVENSETTTKK